MTSKASHLLIVEDEWKIARFLQLELEHEGFTTEIEANGRHALERIVQENFNLVLLDVMLPEMDGIEICKRVREVSDVPIIMVTAKGELDDKVEGLNIGLPDQTLRHPGALGSHPRSASQTQRLRPQGKYFASEKPCFASQPL